MNSAILGASHANDKTTLCPPPRRFIRVVYDARAIERVLYVVVVHPRHVGDHAVTKLRAWNGQSAAQVWQIANELIQLRRKVREGTWCDVDGGNLVDDG